PQAPQVPPANGDSGDSDTRAGNGDTRDSNGDAGTGNGDPRSRLRWHWALAQRGDWPRQQRDGDKDPPWSTGVGSGLCPPPWVTSPVGDTPLGDVPFHVCVPPSPPQSLDLHKPIDKRIYKGTQPTCHDFNQFTAAADTIALLVGFSAGQVQYLDLVKKDTSKLFNEEVSPARAGGDNGGPGSGATATPPLGHGEMGQGFPHHHQEMVAVVRGWLPTPLACVSQDGCLRVFHFDSMLLQGMMKSYFGGLLCVCWSPDGRYVVTGGEDDLVTVWSFAEGRVVARGHGHKSWVNAVAFDPFTGAAQTPQPPELSGGEEEDEPPDPLVRR
ncbi:dystrophia myotonica WD repeat-containing protein-like, partial [Egretta garzetta]|uniref:dystrophia myotonica WD repeat-containing protein-like n=1 Tax=Egretta garzetta TaxID=188379 RepID=UPI00163B7B5D